MSKPLTIRTTKGILHFPSVDKTLDLWYDLDPKSFDFFYDQARLGDFAEGIVMLLLLFKAGTHKPLVAQLIQQTGQPGGKRYHGA